MEKVGDYCRHICPAARKEIMRRESSPGKLICHACGQEKIITEFPLVGNRRATTCFQCRDA